ncbi:hypothetical protein ACLKA6_008536 [Drosophila palustris]
MPCIAEHLNTAYQQMPYTHDIFKCDSQGLTATYADDTEFLCSAVNAEIASINMQEHVFCDFVLRNADPLKQGDFNLWHATKKLKRQPHAQHSVRNPNGQWCQSENDRIEAFADELKDRFTPFDFAPSEHRHRVECFLKQTVITNGINSSATRMRHVTLSELDAYI